MPPDSKIRRVVFDLASLPPWDQDAILNTLTKAERKSVEAHLRDYSEHAAGLTSSPPEPAFDESRISPWLRGRLRGDGEDVELTSAARGALTAFAVQLFPPASKTRRLGFVSKSLLLLRRHREARE